MYANSKYARYLCKIYRESFECFLKEREWFNGWIKIRLN